MFNQEAIEKLSQAQAVTAIAAAVADSMQPGSRPVFAPKDFIEHDLERFVAHRRRARGSMTTQSLEAFAAYTKAHAEVGASVFVAPATMAAVAVLNLGTPLLPGHADNTATWKPRQTAAHAALMAVVRTDHNTQRSLSQTQMAEWLEDWADVVTCKNDDADIETKRAIAAVRAITIESARKVESVQAQLSVESSAFESVKANSKNDPLPTHIVFKAAPFDGFAERTFVLRVAVHPVDKGPTLSLRIARQEWHEEETAKELADKAAAAIQGLPVLLGSYAASK